MPKYAVITIKESLSELQNLYSKHFREKERKKLSSLISLKENEFKTRQDLADNLKINKRTLERWLNMYKSNGIASFLSLPTRNKPSKSISIQVHKKLANRLANPKDSLLGYRDTQRWLKEEFGVQIKYNNLYYYIQTHFKAKLKVGRKSHLKKAPEAVETFLKPSS